MVANLDIQGHIRQKLTLSEKELSGLVPQLGKTMTGTNCILAADQTEKGGLESIPGDD